MTSTSLTLVNALYDSFLLPIEARGFNHMSPNLFRTLTVSHPRIKTRTSSLARGIVAFSEKMDTCISDSEKCSKGSYFAGHMGIFSLRLLANDKEAYR